MRDSIVKLSSPVKSPLSIDEIWLEYKYLKKTHELSTSLTTSVDMTDSVVKLLSPVKSPISIDEMLLEYRYL
jgi:hypothetical protein